MHTGGSLTDESPAVIGWFSQASAAFAASCFQHQFIKAQVHKTFANLGDMAVDSVPTDLHCIGDLVDRLTLGKAFANPLRYGAKSLDCDSQITGATDLLHVLVSSQVCDVGWQAFATAEAIGMPSSRSSDLA
jgi:hypothetical protein